jgi:hypothetical protein
MAWNLPASAMAAAASLEKAGLGFPWLTGQSVEWMTVPFEMQATSD